MAQPLSNNAKTFAQFLVKSRDAPGILRSNLGQFSVQLQNSANSGPLVRHAAVSFARIPNQFYNVDEFERDISKDDDRYSIRFNTQVSWTIGGTSGTVYTHVLTPGYYELSDIAERIKSWLSDDTAGAISDFQMLQNSVTGYTEMYAKRGSAGSTSVYFAHDVTLNREKNLWEQLGFERNSTSTWYFTISSTSLTLVKTSNYIHSLPSPKGLGIACEQLPGATYFLPDGKSAKLLVYFHVHAARGQEIHFDPGQDLEWIHVGKDMTQLQITLVDERLNPVRANDHWEFCLIIEKAF